MVGERERRKNPTFLGKKRKMVTDPDYLKLPIARKGARQLRKWRGNLERG